MADRDACPVWGLWGYLPKSGCMNFNNCSMMKDRFMRCVVICWIFR